MPHSLKQEKFMRHAPLRRCIFETLIRILVSILKNRFLDTELVLQISLHPFDIRNQLVIFGQTGGNIAMNELISSLAKTVICVTEISRKNVLSFY